MTDLVVGGGVIKVRADSTELKAGIEEGKRSVRSLGTELGTSMKQGSDAAQRSVAAYIDKLQLAAASAGKTASETKLLRLEQLGATEAQLGNAAAALKQIEAARLQQKESRLAAEAARVAAAAQSQLGIANKLTAFQSQQLSFQLHDLFVQIASGQNPMTALVQQGSQLSGTFGGLSGTVQALLTVFTPLRVLAGGVAAVLGAVGLAAYQGAQQSAELRRDLALTGNAAGITEGQFNGLAASIAKATNTTIGSARETLQGLVAGGRLGGDALAATATAVQGLARATGRSTDDVAKSFAHLFDDVAKGAEDLNRTYHFLTAEQLRNIQTLVEQGDRQRAVTVTMEALNERLGKQSVNLGSIERAWNAAKIAVSGYIDAAQGVGRTSTVDDQITKLQAEANRLRLAANNQAIASPRQTVAALFGASFEEQAGLIERVIAQLKQSKGLAEQVAAAQAGDATRAEARRAFDVLRENSLSKQAQLAKQLADANALADKAGATAAERASVLAGIRQKFGGLDSDANALTKAALDRDLALIREAFAARGDVFKHAQELLGAQRSAGLVADQAYFNRERELAQQLALTQIQALELDSARRQAASYSGKDAAAKRLEDQKAIVENERAIARIRGDLAAKDQVLAIQQQSASDRRAAAYRTEALAAAQAQEAVKRAYDLELALSRLGEGEAARLTGRAQIQEKYRQEQDRAFAEIEAKRVAAGGAATSDDEKQYEDRVVLIERFRARALAEFDTYYAARQAQDRDAAAGAQKAVADYLDETARTGVATREAVGRGLRTLEDDLTTSLAKGKLSLRGFIDFALQEIIRLSVVRPLMSGFLGALGGGGLLGTGGTALLASAQSGDSLDNFIALSGLAGKRAGGGPVEAGMPYLVGERGPELVVPRRAGTVIPNSAGFGAAGDTYQVIVQGDASANTLRLINGALSDFAAKQNRRR